MNEMARSSSMGGMVYAITAAVLFGASTPFAKMLVGRVEPVLLAGLLYLGSGCGLTAWRWVRSMRRTGSEAPLRQTDLPWLAGAVLFGGIAAPVLLMTGLTATPASSASLLLNLEGVLTALLAWFVFKENFDGRIALGMAAICAGGVVLSWEGRPEIGLPWGPLAVAGACLAWAIDNNLTRKVSAGDPVQIAAIKGLIAGCVNLGIAALRGAELPGIWTALACGFVGLIGYGVSLTLFVLALRALGTARTGAYFSVAPFVGAAISLLLLADRPTPGFFVAAALMGLGVWLHLTERHEHEHGHEEMYHDHRHVHDEHHQHEHGPDDAPGEPHSHPHRHTPVRHSHPHYPDIHHQHGH
jgi:drug/metabolite transporter (DMT)-like permease